MRLSFSVVGLLSCLVVGGGCALRPEPASNIPGPQGHQANQPAAISSDELASTAYASQQAGPRRPLATASDSAVLDLKPNRSGYRAFAGQTSLADVNDEQSADGQVESQFAEAKAAGEITAAQEAEIRRNLHKIPAGMRGTFLAQMLGFNRMSREGSAEGKAPAPLAAADPLLSRQLAGKLAKSSLPNAGVQLKQPTGVDSQIRTVVDPRVKAARYETATSADELASEWKIMLKSPIRSLEETPATGQNTTVYANQQASLRMLYMLSGRRDASMRPIPGLTPEQQKFWSDLVYGLSTYMDDSHVSDRGRRASLATGPLRDALASLSAQGNLVVHHLAFCRGVNSFGVYDKLETKIGKGESRYIFTPGQEVLLYAEVQNFTSMSSAKGYNTTLKPSYAIVNAQGERELPMRALDQTDDFCRRQRHDFFVTYRIYLPKNISPGHHKLELEIVDEKSNKLGQNSIDFEIQGG